MNLSKNQIVMLSIGGVALVASLALGYLAFSAYSAKSEASENAERDSGAVRSLLGAAISPDAASVAAVNKNRDALAGWTEAAISTAAAGDRSIATDVNEIKEKPGKRWESVVAAVIAALVGAAITYFITKK